MCYMKCVSYAMWIGPGWSGNVIGLEVSERAFGRDLSPPILILLPQKSFRSKHITQLFAFVERPENSQVRKGRGDNLRKLVLGEKSRGLDSGK